MLWPGIIFSIFLLAFALIDIRSRLIPNRLLLFAGMVTLCILGSSSMKLLVLGVAGGLFGLAFCGVFYLLCPNKIGAGDVKLSGLIGLMLGVPLIFLALLLAILMGGIVCMILVAFKRLKIKGSIPYAPFLCSGAIVSLWIGDWLINSYLGLF